MKPEKILNKKFDRLNQLKSLLISRTDRTKDEIVEEIKDTLEDLELILEDYEYINTKVYSEIEDNLTRFSSEDSNYNNVDNKEGIEFTLDEIEKYDGTCGKREYISVNNKVYDVTDNPEWNEKGLFCISKGRNKVNNYTAINGECLEELNKLPLIGHINE